MATISTYLPVALHTSYFPTFVSIKRLTITPTSLALRHTLTGSNYMLTYLSIEPFRLTHTFENDLFGIAV